MKLNQGGLWCLSVNCELTQIKKKKSLLAYCVFLIGSELSYSLYSKIYSILFKVLHFISSLSPFSHQRKQYFPSLQEILYRCILQ